MAKHTFVPLVAFLGAWLLLLCISYGLVAPNLLFFSSSWYFAWQNWMWQTFFHNRYLFTTLFIVAITTVTLSYRQIIQQLKTNSLQLSRSVLLPLGCSILIATGTYNFSSLDLFNYLFNAKMMIVYQADPHVKVALDFPNDPWVRFMHNTHTPAPYGYGWTLLSLPPLWLGHGVFSLTWLLFKGMSVLSLILTAWALKVYARRAQIMIKPWQYAALLLQPLVLLEVLANGHNDLWMMAPAILSLALLQGTNKKYSLSLVLLIFSIAIKWATLVLLPVWVLLVVLPRLPKILPTLVADAYALTPLMASILLFVPLLTLRSQQFLPWYLTWGLVWVPVILATTQPGKWISRLWLQVLQILAVTSLFRAVPLLIATAYTPVVTQQEKAITWLPLVVFGCWWSSTAIVKKLRGSVN